MNKKNLQSTVVKILAYFHRYGWIFVTILCVAIWLEQKFLVFGISFIVISIWSFVGYKCKWRHIYCSHQDSSHQAMTPDSIKWNEIEKREAYGESLVLFVLGMVSICVHFFF
jgi:hypothetical protein